MHFYLFHMMTSIPPLRITTIMSRGIHFLSGSEHALFCLLSRATSLFTVYPSEFSVHVHTCTLLLGKYDRRT